MGQIADMIVNGEMCSHCGICFEEEHGYPVLCDNCFKEQQADKTINKKDRIQKHQHPEL